MFDIGTRSKKRTCSVAAIAFASGLLLSTAVFAESAVSHYDIPAENGAKALLDFSRQAGVQILYPYDVAAKHETPAIKGDFTREQVLEKILAGTGLEIATSTDTTISLREAKPSGGAAEPKATEVVVTGTRIRNAQPTSPVHILGRAEIDNSGYAQIGDLMRSLPENFAGGQNPGVIAADATNGANQNTTNATSLNLRGIGSDATLVLVNGHRLASDGFNQASDISGVPLAAVQRIEVVTDGASALYGADAVAGVANIVMRKNFNGGQASATVSAPTQGAGLQRLYNFMAGGATTNAFGLMSVEFSDQDGITAGDRDYTSGTPADQTLIRPETRKSAFVSGGVSITDDLSLSVDALVSDRKSSNTSLPFTGYDPYYGNDATRSYSLATAMEYGFSAGWKLRVSGVASASVNSVFSALPAYDYYTHSRFKNEVQYGEVTADGPLFHLPSGDVRVAVGGGYRQEAYHVDQEPSPPDSGERKVSFLYAEGLVPLVSPSDQRAGLHQFDISFSARAEDYSDLGQTFNPRIGFRYVPASGLTLRGTVGTSFKAPSFNQMYQTSVLYLWKASNFGYTGGGTALMTSGANPDLKPEKSTSWTFGADYSPQTLPSLKLGVTYFDIDYTDRVIQPINTLTTGLVSPFFAPFVEWNPSTTRQQELIGQADTFVNYSGAAYNAGNVVAILQNKYANATGQSVHGVDLSYSQSFDIGKGTLSVFGNGSWIDLRQQTLITLPEVKLSGTIFNVPEYRARAGTTWLAGNLTWTGIVNYVSGETDTGMIPAGKVASWTTIDTNVQYKVKTFGRGVRLGLAITNLLDKDPSFAESPSVSVEGIHFDSTNTSVIGRTIILSVTQSW